MLSILYGIAALLTVFALPYVMTIWNLRHTPMRCMRIEPVSAKEIPEHIKAILKEAIAELKPHGFKMASCHQIEYGAEKEGKQWGVLLQHSSGQTYAGLMTRQLIDSTAPLIFTFMTSFEDDIQLNTLNTPAIKIYSPNPAEIIQYAGAVAIAPQWQLHQQKLAELSQTCQIQILSVQALLKTLETRNQASIERLVKTREVSWITPGKSYQLSWVTAARAVYQLARKNKPSGQPDRQSDPKSDPKSDLKVDVSTSNSATPLVELEIEEFHRLQQKQRKGLSQRGKSWLLLGTLALFIASYSSVFEPQKLLIFVGALLLHEGGHVLAMKFFGYRDTVMLFIPFLGALATARKDDASLTEKVWISLAGPLPGLALGIGLAIASSFSDLTDPSAMTWFEESNWIREASWTLIILNLFNLLPVYPLDGGQVADLLLFSRNPYLGVLFKGIGVLLLGLIGLAQPLMLVFALLIAITIPTSFRLAKLSSRFRKDLRRLPHSDRDGILRFLFTQLQAPPYRSLLFPQKYNLVMGLLSTHQENAAKWSVRASLTGIYLTSLLAGLAGGLYAFMPNWTAWTLIVGSWINPEGVYRQHIQQELEAANRSLQANPKDVQAYLERGRAKLALQDYAGAIADANQVLQIDPNSGHAYQLRGFAYQRMGNTAGAEADRKKGAVLIAQHRLEQLNQQLSQNPKDAEAYLDRASLYLSLEHYSEAIADSNRALLIDPDNTEAILWRGEAYLSLNQYPEALGNANHVLRLDPSSGDAYQLRSRVYSQMGNETMAIADEQKAETLFDAQEEEL
jgi:tetratricopeptide (TPR) repeat protein/Zn-dependent protease